MILLRFSAALGALFLFAACSTTPPSRLYLLDARSPRLATALPAGPVVRLEPVRVPGHLQRPLLLTHKNANELAFSEFERWGEELSENIHRVLGQNLRRLLPPPAPDNAAGEIRISVEILRLTVLQGQAMLAAQVDIGKAGASPLRLSPQHQRPVAGATPAEVVAAYSQLMADLAADIAAALMTTSPADTPPQK